MQENNQHILVIKLGALGDFIQALGPMQAIRKKHQNAKITLLTTVPFEKFARECGYFDSILIDKRPKFLDFSGWLSLRQTLNVEKFDRVYDLQNNDRTNLYFKLFSPKPEWVGVAKGASHRNTSPERTKGHAFDGHVQTLALAGIKNIQPDTLEWMKGDLNAFELKKPYVLLVPGCAPQHPKKRWPATHYAQTANILHDKGYQPIIIGTKAEEEAAKLIKTECPNALDLINQTSFYQIATLARNAYAAIGNDTGPMHLIATTGCRALVLFSQASNPIKHAPKGTNVHTIQKEALSDLNVNEVIKAVIG